MYDIVGEEIAQRINIVDVVGRYVELHQKGNEYFGLCPFHAEITPSFSVTPATGKFYCFGCGVGGNVITFLSKYKDISYKEACQELIDEIGTNAPEWQYSETYSYIRKYNSYFRNQRKQYSHTVLDHNVLENFVKTSILPWLSEGISQEAMDKYEVMLDVQSGRIVYPVYSNEGELINVKGRLLYDDMRSSDEPKYMNYYKVGVADYLQCYSVNKDFIKEKNEIIIFEGIKSCMKMDDIGIHNCVSAETSRLSDEQIRFLISLQSDVVIAFDKDVEIEKIRKNLYMLRRFVNTSVIYDRFNLLPDKHSPIDMGRDVWNKLYESKIQLR